MYLFNHLSTHRSQTHHSFVLQSSLAELLLSSSVSVPSYAVPFVDDNILAELKFIQCLDTWEGFLKHRVLKFWVTFSSMLVLLDKRHMYSSDWHCWLFRRNFQHYCSQTIMDWLIRYFTDCQPTASYWKPENTFQIVGIIFFVFLDNNYLMITNRPTAGWEEVDSCLFMGISA